MRLVGASIVVAGLVAGCQPPPGGGDDYPPYTYDPGNPSPPDNGGCNVDADCGAGNICARDFSCIPPSEAYVAHIAWTIGGKTASPATCASLPDLDLQFTTSDDYWFGFSPIACDQGKFTIDKLPIWYVQTTLGPEGDRGTSAQIDPTTGIAMLDLPY